MVLTAPNLITQGFGLEFSISKFKGPFIIHMDSNGGWSVVSTMEGVHVVYEQKYLKNCQT